MSYSTFQDLEQIINGLKTEVADLKEHNQFLSDMILSISPDALSEAEELRISLRLSTDEQVRTECERLLAENKRLLALLGDHQSSTV